MVRDLKKRYLNKRINRSEIIDLLGQPEQEKNGIMFYIIGAWSGLRIDYDSFNIYLNKDGELVGTSLQQH
jgi:tRNA U34 2-thiouridine synthase MnmA/TrmU